jgi:Putative adhesin
MQHHQEFEHPSNTPEETPAPLKERQINTDPREQPPPQESTYRSYEEGYADQSERDYWPYEGEKLQPEPKNQKSIGGLLALVVLLCAVFIAGSFFGAILSWLTWVMVIVLIIAGLVSLATNWRVVTIPMPTRSFQSMEHARLVINNGAGTVSIRRGEEGMVSVTATKRASGIGIDADRMQINYNQYGDTLDISSRMSWSILQFGLRTVDFEITVPYSCDVHLQNGSGQVAVQGTSGEIRVRTGSGRVYAYDLQGRIAMKTGSGRIEAGNLHGLIDLHTGSSRIEAQNLQGQLIAKTGSGRIEISQAALSGDSSLKTGSNSITFDGSLDALGSYTFQTGSGGITLRLPDDAAFSLDARTSSGGVHNEFGSNEVGNGPHAPLKLRTGSGAIRIYRLLNPQI